MEELEELDVDESDERLLSAANGTNSTDDADAVVEQLTLQLLLNGVRPTCRQQGGCAMSLVDLKTPFVHSVSPANGSYADGTQVTISMAMAEAPVNVKARHRGPTWIIATIHRALLYHCI